MSTFNMEAEEAKMAESRTQVTAFDKVDIKVEDSVISMENDPSHEQSFDVTLTTVKVKTEFIPEAEDLIYDVSNANNLFQISKNETSQILTEQPGVPSEDPTSADEGANRNFLERGPVRIKEESTEGKEEVVQASDDDHATASFEHHADFEADNKAFQATIFCDETDGNLENNLDSKIKLIHVSSSHSEASTMKVSDSYDTDDSQRFNEMKQPCSKSNAVTQPDGSVLSCDRCFAEFRDSFEMKQHLMSHSNDQQASDMQNIVAFKAENYATRHLDVHANDQPLLRPQRTKSFKTKSYLEKRSAAVHAKTRQHCCTQCPARFEFKSQLVTHSAVHSIAKPFSCMHCAATFNNKGNMKRHLLIHSDEKPFSCPHCNLTFKTNHLLKSHLLVHSVGKPFTCKQCFATFKTKLGFKLHASVHSSERLFACHYCSWTFKTKPGLKQHLTVHSNVKRYSCAQCSATFRDKHGLSSHSSVHSSEKPFLCAQCPAVFKTKQNLKVHVVKHLNKVNRKVFSCDHCTSSFKTEKGLRGHLKRAHAIKRRLSCSHCEAPFKTKLALRKHLPLHSKPASISCPHCAAKFKNKPGLRNHITIHLNEKLFSCEQCSSTLKLDSLIGGQIAVCSSDQLFSCGHCKAKFKSELAFRLHSAVHLKEKLCKNCAYYVKSNP